MQKVVLLALIVSVFAASPAPSGKYCGSKSVLKGEITFKSSTEFDLMIEVFLTREDAIDAILPGDKIGDLEFEERFAGGKDITENVRLVKVDTMLREIARGQFNLERG